MTIEPFITLINMVLFSDTIIFLYKILQLITICLIKDLYRKSD
jgi:hypothetical protein